MERTGNHFTARRFIHIRISMLLIRLCIFPTESLEPRIRTDMNSYPLRLTEEAIANSLRQQTSRILLAFPVRE